MGIITTKNDNYGGTPAFVAGIDHTGSTTTSFFATSGDPGSPGIVIYQLYINYTGSAGVYLTLYDANGKVGAATSKPAIIGTGIKAQFYTKASGLLISAWPGYQFINGVVFVASAGTDQSANPDSTTVSLCFSYA